MARNDRSRRGRRHSLTPEQNVLFKKLERIAAPIIQTRTDAAGELGLLKVIEALEDELMINNPPYPEPATKQQYENLKRTWDKLMRRLDDWILEELKRGRIFAYGIPLPITPSTVAMPIPTGIWHTHVLDVEQGTVLGEHWSFKEVRVVFTANLPPKLREVIEKGLWVFGTWMFEDMIEAKRRELGRQGGVTKRNSTAPAPGVTEGNPLLVRLISVADRVVVKTERMNRNTIHGKTARPKPKPAKKAAQNSNLTAEETISVAAPRPRRDPGPRTLNPEIAAYLEERARAGKCKQTLAEECDHLYAWAKKTYALEIRTKARKLAGRKRLREAHSKAYYRLNPEFDRLRRFKQEST